MKTDDRALLRMSGIVKEFPGVRAFGGVDTVVDLVRAIADETDPLPSFADGLQVQRVLAAVETSSDNRTLAGDHP